MRCVRKSGRRGERVCVRGHVCDGGHQHSWATVTPAAAVERSSATGLSRYNYRSAFGWCKNARQRCQSKIKHFKIYVAEYFDKDKLFPPAADNKFIQKC